MAKCPEIPRGQDGHEFPSQERIRKFELAALAKENMRIRLIAPHEH